MSLSSYLLKEAQQQYDVDTRIATPVVLSDKFDLDDEEVDKKFEFTNKLYDVYLTTQKEVNLIAKTEHSFNKKSKILKVISKNLKKIEELEKELNENQSSSLSKSMKKDFSLTFKKML